MKEPLKHFRNYGMNKRRKVGMEGERAEKSAEGGDKEANEEGRREEISKKEIRHDGRRSEKRAGKMRREAKGEGGMEEEKNKERNEKGDGNYVKRTQRMKRKGEKTRKI